MKGRWAWITVSSLYVILEVYSRYAIGWLVAPHESDRLAQELIAACATAELRLPPLTDSGGYAARSASG